MDQYRFERISPDNYPQFIGLAKDAFAVDFSLEDARRLFDTKSFGVDHVGFLAFHTDTGEAAAFYGIFPCFVEIDGRRILAAQSGSTMTHPDHRRRNLFVLTAEKTYELARAEGIAFVYGMPNEFSYRGLMKLGWTHLDDAIRYRFFVPTLPIGLIGKKVKVIDRIHRRLFAKVTSRWRIPNYPMSSSVLEPGVGGLHRSEASIDYKPEDENHVMLRIGGTGVWINRIGAQIGIGDIGQTPPVAKLRKVLRVVKWIGFLSGCNFVRTYLSPGCKLDRDFSRAGYKGSKSLANCYLDLAGGTEPEKFKWVYGDYDTF
jgi:hypothetical protein